MSGLAPYRRVEDPLGAAISVHGVPKGRVALVSFAFAIGWTANSLFFQGLERGRWKVVFLQALLSLGLCGLTYFWRIRKESRLTLYERGVQIEERGVVRRIGYSDIRSVETGGNALWLTLTSGERQYVAWITGTETICTTIRNRLPSLGDASTG